MNPHDKIRVLAAQKLLNVISAPKNATLPPSILQAATEAADAQADYAITRLIDRLRGHRLHAVAALIELFTLPPQDPQETQES